MNAQPATSNDRRDLHGSDPQTVEICNALSAMGVENGEYDLLMRSLPYDLCNNDDRLRRKLADQRSFAWRENGEERCVTFTQVAIVPQGVGAQESFHRASKTRPSVMCLVDVGSYTLDVVVTKLHEGTNKYAYHPTSGSKRYECVTTNGFKTLLDKRLQSHGMKRQLGYHELMELVEKSLETNELKVYDQGEYIDISEDLADLRRRLTSDVLRTLTEELLAGPIWNRVNEFILTGGGAQLMDFAWWTDRRVPAKMDVFANAVGQWHAGAALLAQKAA
jgi:hypothetical protein